MPWQIVLDGSTVTGQRSDVLLLAREALVAHKETGFLSVVHPRPLGRAMERSYRATLDSLRSGGKHHYTESDSFPQLTPGLWFCL
jgi:hypothetical protein